MTTFTASSCGAHAYKSPLLNSQATIRERTCIGSSSSALSISIHFVSTEVTLYFRHGCALIDLLVQANFTQVFQVLCSCYLRSMPRQLLASDVKHLMNFFSSSASANVASSSRFLYSTCPNLTDIPTYPTSGAPISIFFTTFPTSGAPTSIFLTKF